MHIYTQQSCAKHNRAQAPGVTCMFLQGALNHDLHQAPSPGVSYFKKSPAGEGKTLTAETRAKYDKKYK